MEYDFENSLRICDEIFSNGQEKMKAWLYNSHSLLSDHEDQLFYLKQHLCALCRKFIATNIMRNFRKFQVLKSARQIFVRVDWGGEEVIYSSPSKVDEPISEDTYSGGDVIGSPGRRRDRSYQSRG